jgi:hypothetical protein
MRPAKHGLIEDTDGNLEVLGGKSFKVARAAIATTATNGFLQIPTCAGAPTGTPDDVTGASLVYDTTNGALCVYDPVGGAWETITVDT